MTPLQLVRKAVTPVISLDEWKRRVATREAKVGIIGLGYVGLPLALLFSEEKFRVTGFDIDPLKVRFLNEGKSYIHRIERAEIERAREAGLQATSDFAAIDELDVVLICVPTPIDDHS